MINKIWSGASRLYLLLLPFSWLYGAISGVRRLGYRCHLFSSWRSPVPVVVVGNLTVGGNGKTPVVIWLVEQLTARGMKVGVVSRGYGGRAEHYPLLIGDNTSAAEGGDEPVLIYQRTGVPVAVAPARVAAVKFLLQHYSLDLILTDDGLQHYALQRDLEIVVIDGERRFGNGWWLPAGPMRERAGRLSSVDAVIVNGGAAMAGETAMYLQAGQAINLLTGERKNITELPNLVAMAGIGHPARFFSMLQQQQLTLLHTHAFSDHQVYTEELLAPLATVEETLLMTEKDAVKCHSFAQPNWWFLPVSATLSEGDAALLLSKISTLSCINTKKSG